MSLRHRGPKTHSDEKNTQSFGKHDGSHFGDIGIDEMIIKIQKLKKMDVDQFYLAQVQKAEAGSTENGIKPQA